MAPLVAIVSFRLGGPDGVSVVAEHWAGAFRRLGLAVRTVAGSGRADRLLPDLAMDATPGPGLAGRLDLTTAFAPPEARPQDGLERWLQGMDLDPGHPEPMLLLLRTPPPSGRGCLLLLDADGGLLGGHTFRVAG